MNVRRRLRVAAALAIVATLWFGAGARAQVTQERVLDDFDDLSAWSVTATDDVKAALRSSSGPNGKAACLDFDFGRVTGYVALRRKLPIEFPARYDVGFDVRGEMAPNALQLKFSDASGDNVWWAQRSEYRPPAQWQRLRLRQRHIEFAWGPTSDRVLRRTEWVEFVIASGGGGGKGSVCVDRLTLRELAPAPAAAPVPLVRASSSRAGHAPFAGLVSAPDAVPIPAKADAPDWQPASRGDASPLLTIDYGSAQEFSALLLHWRPGAAASRYTIEQSDDGVAWRSLQRVERARCLAGALAGRIGSALRAPALRPARRADRAA